jgi:hypothetical protein
VSKLLATVHSAVFSGLRSCGSHLSYRTFHIAYDYVQKVARADIEAGYEAAKYYIRRYDQVVFVFAWVLSIAE